MRRALPSALLLLAVSAAALAQDRPLPPVPEARPPELSTRADATDWARTLGWPTGLAAPSMEPIHSAGVLVERHRFRDGAAELRARGSGDGRAIWERYVAALRRAGSTVENEWVGGSAASATVCERDCAAGRYFITLAWDSWVWLTLRRAASGPPTPSSACESLPDARFCICWTSNDGRSECSFPYETRFDVDVDRDGRADALVPIPNGRAPERSCPRDVEWDVYVMRSGCGHRVGRLRGDVDRWSAAGAETSHGFVTLHTSVDPAGPWDEAISLRYRFQRGQYREVAMTRHVSRCEVHPADCEGGVSRTICAVRAHPTILAPFDDRASGALLVAAAEQAQRDCSARIAPPVRCEIDLEVAPDGTTRRLRVTGCRRATSCVRGVFGRLAYPPFSGDPQPRGISFQVPAP